MEPKFKKGDRVIYRRGTKDQNICQVTDVVFDCETKGFAHYSVEPSGEGFAWSYGASEDELIIDEKLIEELLIKKLGAIPKYRDRQRVEFKAGKVWYEGYVCDTKRSYNQPFYYRIAYVDPATGWLMHNKEGQPIFWQSQEGEDIRPSKLDLINKIMEKRNGTEV